MLYFVKCLWLNCHVDLPSHPRLILILMHIYLTNHNTYLPIFEDVVKDTCSDVYLHKIMPLFDGHYKERFRKK